jgi:ABC-type thiamine transport system substrate-binding protein
MKSTPILLALLAAGTVTTASAQEKVLNLYSARHYQTDEALYANFTKQTGIKINRIEAKEDELLERIRNEGANSPADIFLTVDAARLAKADELGLFAPVKSKLLEERIPANLRSPDWFAFSTRARVIVANKAAVKAEDVQNYEDLANPQLKGKVCSRSGSHPYNISLMSALIAHIGEAKAEEWARGVVANFARTPKGGDTDQIKSVAAGECGVAVSNTYYLARLLRSEKPEDQAPDGARHHHLAEPEKLRHPHQHFRRRHAEDRPEQGIGRQVPRVPCRRRRPALLRRRQQRMAGGGQRGGEESGAGSHGQVQGGQSASGDAGEKCRRRPAYLRPRRLEIIKPTAPPPAGALPAPYRQRRLLHATARPIAKPVPVGDFAAARLPL